MYSRSQRWWKREGSGEEKEQDSGRANSVNKAGYGGARIPRWVSRSSGRSEEPLGGPRSRWMEGWFNSPCCHRDPARSLEQGPEGPDTPIQVVLRWV